MLIEHKQLNKVIELVDKWLREGGDQLNSSLACYFLFQKIFCLVNLGKFSEALEATEKALKLEPNNENILYFRVNFIHFFNNIQYYIY